MSNKVWDTKRIVLVLAAFFFGGAVPIQTVTLSFGYAQYFKNVALGPKAIMTAHEFARIYVPALLIPALIALAAIAVYARRNYPDITRRIVVGLAAGAIATVALDFARQMGVIQKWLPADTPTIFGKTVTGSRNFAVYYPVGFAIHFLNGANFGLFFVFVWGKRRTYASAIGWAVFWAVLVEIGMMTLPPMGRMVGPFGINYAWPQLFLLTLVAHLLFGVALGILSQYFLTTHEAGGLIRFLRGTSSVEHVARTLERQTPQREGRNQEAHHATH